jgi:hypothetical protein
MSNQLNTISINDLDAVNGGAQKPDPQVIGENKLGAPVAAPQSVARALHLKNIRPIPVVRP